MYAQQAKQNENTSPDSETNTDTKNESDVVDAEYKEVNKDK